MRPVYNKHVVGANMVLNHELGHMWLGDTVTLQDWNETSETRA